MLHTNSKWHAFIMVLFQPLRPLEALSTTQVSISSFTHMQSQSEGAIQDKAAVHQSEGHYSTPSRCSQPVQVSLSKISHPILFPMAVPKIMVCECLLLCGTLYGNLCLCMNHDLCTAKCFEWLQRLEKHYINAARLVEFWF